MPVRSPRLVTRRLALSAAMALVAAGCATTQLVNLWRDPEFHGPAIHSVLVVSMRRDAVTRRMWEDSFVSALERAGADATPSYSVFPERLPSEERLRQRMQESQYDAILFVRPAGAREETRYYPGYSSFRPMYWRDPFWSTYGVAYARVYHPGYIERERIVRLDISLWTTSGEGRLVWAATSRTLNPSSAGELGDEVSHHVVPELKKADLL